MSTTLLKKQKTKVCNNCNTDFVVTRKRGTSKYCSTLCGRQKQGGKGMVHKPKPNCLVCNKQVTSQKNKTNKCQECYFVSMPKKTKDDRKSNCIECNVQISDKYRIYCRSCSHKGQRNIKWKGGISSIVTRIRTTKSYRNWRTLCFLRDNRTCNDCGYTGQEIQAHHIKPTRDILKGVKTFEEAMAKNELFDISNGITLCVDCHYKIGRNENDYAKKYKLIINNKNI